jgi:hypothetical protein
LPRNLRCDGARGSIDGLIKALSDKNRQNAAGAKGADAAKLAPVLMIYSSEMRAPKE